MNPSLLFLLIIACIAPSESAQRPSVHAPIPESEILQVKIKFGTKGVYKRAKITVSRREGVKEVIYFHPIQKDEWASNPHYLWQDDHFLFQCEPKKVTYYIDRRFPIKYLKRKHTFVFLFQPEDDCQYQAYYYVGEKVYQLSVPLTAENRQKAEPDYVVEVI